MRVTPSKLVRVLAIRGPDCRSVRTHREPTVLFQANPKTDLALVYL